MAQPTFPPDAPSFADGRFVLVSRIGAGTVGAVYRGYDRKQQGWRAVKVLAPDRASDPSARSRFVAAAEAFAALAHPNLVRVYEVGATVQPYAVMELVSGGTVGAWSERYGAMPPGLAAGTVLEATRGLAALHAAGLAHGHVRAHNVLVSAGGVRKLGDAGLGASDGDRLRDLRDLGRLLAGLVEQLPPALAWIAEEAGEALDTADAVADAIEAILGDLPAEPPGTPDPVLDRSAAEVPLRPGNHPEILALLAAYAPAPVPSPAPPVVAGAPTPASRRFADPGDYDDEALDAPPVPSRVGGAGVPARDEPVGPGVPARPAPGPEPEPEPVPAPEPQPEPEPELARAPQAADSMVYVEFTDTPVEPTPVQPVSGLRDAPSPEPVWVVEDQTPAALPRSSLHPTPAPLEAPPPAPAAAGPRRAAVRSMAVEAPAAAPSNVSASSAASPLGCLRWVLLPTAVGLLGLVLSVVLAFVVLLSGVLEVVGAEGDTADAAEQLMTALDKSQPTVERLIAIGADEAVLHERLVEFQSRRNGPGQLDAAIALVEVVEAAGDELLGERVQLDNMKVDHDVRSLRAAHRQYDQARSDWASSSEAWRGAIAVQLGLAGAPDARWP